MAVQIDADIEPLRDGNATGGIIADVLVGALLRARQTLQQILQGGALVANRILPGAQV